MNRLYTVFVVQSVQGEREPIQGFLTDGGELVQYPSDGCCEFKLQDIAAGLEALDYDGCRLVRVQIELVGA